MSSIDLILHIGLPKSASTSLQKYLAKFPTYLGKKGSRLDDDYATRLLNILDEVSSSSRDKKIMEWVHEVENEFLELAGSTKAPLVLSSEELSLGNRLDKIKNTSIWRNGKVKVLLVLRNQCDWMASAYSQEASMIPGASQYTFECKAMSDANVQKHDWCFLAHKAIDIFGVDNVFITLFEELIRGEDTVIPKMLSEYARIDNFDLQLKPYNVKRLSESEWRLSKFGNMKLHRGDAAINAILAHGYENTRVKLRLMAGLRFLLTQNIENKIVSYYEKTRSEKIYVTDDLKKYIRTMYFSSNCRLAQLLERDLSVFGY